MTVLLSSEEEVRAESPQSLLDRSPTFVSTSLNLRVKMIGEPSGVTSITSDKSQINLYKHLNLSFHFKISKHYDKMFSSFL